MSRLKQAVMRGLYVVGAPAILRRLPVPRDTLVILAYHAVTDDPRYALPGIRVTPDLFAKQMDYLARNHDVVDLAEAVAQRRAGVPLPRFSVAITFDDGYRDNYEMAFPVLRKYGFPATVFATVSPVLDGARFWVAWLYEVLCNRMDLPAIRDVFGVNAPGDVEGAFDAISRVLNYKGFEEREALLDEFLARIGGLEIPNRMMNLSQMREIQRFGVRLGSHTLSHPILANLSAAERRHELQRSRERLSEALDSSIDLIAYPNGRSIPGNFDDAVINDCVAAGYKAAVTSRRGPVTGMANDHALPRMGVSQSGGMARFALTLSRMRLQAARPSVPH